MHKILLKLFWNSCSDNRQSRACPEPRRRIENRKLVGIVAIALTFAFGGAVAHAQPAKVDWDRFSGSHLPLPATQTGWKRCGRVCVNLGYLEGKNLVIESRWAEGKFDRLPELAAELVHLNVNVILTAGTPGDRAAKNATTTIPVVMVTSGDPVGFGFVASLARPGGNITGSSTFSPELSAGRQASY